MTFALVTTAFGPSIADVNFWILEMRNTVSGVP